MGKSFGVAVLLAAGLFATGCSSNAADGGVVASTAPSVASDLGAAAFWDSMTGADQDYLCVSWNTGTTPGGLTTDKANVASTIAQMQIDAGKGNSSDMAALTDAFYKVLRKDC